MSLTLILLLTPVAMAGHVALWITFWNRIQGTMMPMWMLSSLDWAAKLCCGAVPFAVAIAVSTPVLQATAGVVAICYFALATAIGAIGVPFTWLRRLRNIPGSTLRKSTSVVRLYDDLARQSKAELGFRDRILLSVPGNQSFEIEQNEKELEIPRLNEALDGLSIAHISDLHFTGRVTKQFFDRAVDLVNEMNADIVVVTGDLVDEKPYLSWIPVTLGRLRARHGVYVIFGNHDCKQNLANLRLVLSESGLLHMGGRLRKLNIRGNNVILAGNELPWITPAADMFDCPPREDLDHLRILMSHTPDQLHWARHFDFDLMLAGHTHGGQFCVPGFGPVVCPSRLPLEYAAGTIYAEPTVLHVSRGLSGEVPLRLNCRPEITKLVLRCPLVNKEVGELESSIAGTIDEINRDVASGQPQEDESELVQQGAIQ